ncbi:hypothetical protein QYM36_005780 [Artemia franciscana]|uniref:Uncharacterized protein n=1 Tax=Artemia franciscana TaxID=6661 RepID=A0AA88LA36_ARTSF|nr:hypothetical protein QYM36_005780 [Artemia franciscana]
MCTNNSVQKNVIFQKHHYMANLGPKLSPFGESLPKDINNHKQSLGTVIKDALETVSNGKFHKDLCQESLQVKIVGPPPAPITISLPSKFYPRLNGYNSFKKSVLGEVCRKTAEVSKKKTRKDLTKSKERRVNLNSKQKKIQIKKQKSQKPSNRGGRKKNMIQ